MKLVRNSILVALGSIFLSGCATTISGQLVDSTGKEIKVDDATVNVSSLSGQNISEIIEVDIEGYFSSKASLPDGSYYVEVLAPGYKINGLQVEVSESRNLIFKMRKTSSQSIKGLSIEATKDYSKGNGNATIRPPQF